MAKAKISKKPKKSSRKSRKVLLTKHSIEDFDFNQPLLVKTILAECIISGDMDTFQDVLIGFIRSQTKTKLAKKAKLGRRTLYDLLDDEQKFNPEWDTLCSILKAI